MMRAICALALAQGALASETSTRSIGDIINSVNQYWLAWERGIAPGFTALTDANVTFEIPAAAVSLSGQDAVWGYRNSLAKFGGDNSDLRTMQYPIQHRVNVEEKWCTIKLQGIAKTAISGLPSAIPGGVDITDVATLGEYTFSFSDTWQIEHVWVDLFYSPELSFFNYTRPTAQSPYKASDLITPASSTDYTADDLMNHVNNWLDRWEKGITQDFYDVNAPAFRCNTYDTTTYNNVGIPICIFNATEEQQQGDLMTYYSGGLQIYGADALWQLRQDIASGPFNEPALLPGGGNLNNKEFLWIFLPQITTIDVEEKFVQTYPLLYLKNTSYNSVQEKFYYSGERVEAALMSFEFNTDFKAIGVYFYGYWSYVSNDGPADLPTPLSPFRPSPLNLPTGVYTYGDVVGTIGRFFFNLASTGGAALNGPTNLANMMTSDALFDIPALEVAGYGPDAFLSVYRSEIAASRVNHNNTDPTDELSWIESAMGHFVDLEHKFVTCRNMKAMKRDGYALNITAPVPRHPDDRQSTVEISDWQFTFDDNWKISSIYIQIFNSVVLDVEESVTELIDSPYYRLAPCPPGCARRSRKALFGTPSSTCPEGCYAPIYAS